MEEGHAESAELLSVRSSSIILLLQQKYERVQPQQITVSQPLRQHEDLHECSFHVLCSKAPPSIVKMVVVVVVVDGGWWPWLSSP